MGDSELPTNGAQLESVEASLVLANTGRTRGGIRWWLKQTEYANASTWVESKGRGEMDSFLTLIEETRFELAHSQIYTENEWYLI